MQMSHRQLDDTEGWIKRIGQDSRHTHIISRYETIRSLSK